MPRRLRVEFPGAIYHVMSRGDRREDILRDDVDRQDFLNFNPQTRTVLDGKGKPREVTLKAYESRWL